MIHAPFRHMQRWRPVLRPFCLPLQRPTRLLLPIAAQVLPSQPADFSSSTNGFHPRSKPSATPPAGIPPRQVAPDAPVSQSDIDCLGPRRCGPPAPAGGLGTGEVGDKTGASGARCNSHLKRPALICQVHRRRRQRREATLRVTNKQARRGSVVSLRARSKGNEAGGHERERFPWRSRVVRTRPLSHGLDSGYSREDTSAPKALAHAFETLKVSRRRWRRSFVERPPPPPSPVTDEWKRWKIRYTRQQTFLRQVGRLLPAKSRSSEPDAGNGGAGVLEQPAHTDEATPSKTKFNHWKRQFSRARKAYRTHGPGPQFESPLLRLETSHDMAAAWENVPQPDRLHEFEHTIFLTLKTAPERTHLVIEAILPRTTPTPPHYIFEDTIRLIVRLAADAPDAVRERRMHEAFSCIRTVISHTPPAYVNLSPKTLVRLIDLCEHQDVQALYRCLTNYKHELGVNTLLQFAARFAQDSAPGGKHEAVGVMGRLTTSQPFNINWESARKVSVSILSSNKSQSEGDHRPAALMQALLGMGLQPNLIIYTALVQNLAASGGLSTAWAVFDNMLGQGISPDSALINVLITASHKARDAASLARALSHVPDLTLMGQFGLDLLLHTILYWPQPRVPKPTRRQTSFHLLMSAYSSIYDMAPLRQVCGQELDECTGPLDQGVDPEIVGVINSIRQRPAAEPMTPTPSTLRIMVVGYIASLMQPYSVVSLYASFDRLLRQGDPLVASLVEGDNVQVHNAFMKALSAFEVSRPAAFDVMKDLLQDNQMRSYVTDKGHGATPRRPRPDVISWTILLYGLLKDREIMQAEGLLRTMQEHLCQPDQVTWNVLVGGYARMQSVVGTVDALRRMEAAGFTADRHTIEAFGRLRDKTRALSMLAQVIKKRNGDNPAAFASIPGGNVAGYETVDEDVPETGRLEFDRISKDLLGNACQLFPPVPAEAQPEAVEPGGLKGINTKQFESKRPANKARRATAKPDDFEKEFESRR